MLSSAERQKRYRRHSKGDHSLCDPKRCPELKPPSPVVETPPQRAPVARPELQGGYGPRGQSLWDEMADAKLGPAHRVLLQEACRIADRLDRLDAMLDGRESWIRLRSRDDEQTEFVVIVDGMLAEARQQATALRSLVAEIRAALPAAKKTTARQAEPEPTSKGPAGVASLAARAARRRASAG